MRLSITAIPAQPTQPGLSTAGAALEGRTLRARLGREDTGFDVVEVDPGVDLAEQLETIFGERNIGWRDSVLFYAACPALMSVDNELFLCLDPAAPNVGDAIADVAAVLRDQAPGPKLVVLDLVDAKLGTDPSRAEALVRAAEAAIEPATSGIELLLVARHPSPDGFVPAVLADAIVAELDSIDRGRGLTVRGLYDRLQRKLRAQLPLIYHARTKVSFELVPLKPGAKPSILPDGRAHTTPDEGTNPLAGKDIAALRSSGETAAVAIPPPGRVSGTLRPPPAADPVDHAWNDDAAVAPEPVIAPIRKLAAPPGASLPPPPNQPPAGTDGPSSGPRSGPISGRSIGISPLARYTVEGELSISQGDSDGAIAAFRKALAVLGPGGDPDSRAELYARIGELRAIKGDTEGAISDFEKALALRPGHVPALESLITLCVAEKDWRGVMSAEERLLAALPSDTLRFERLIEFASRWETVIDKLHRARQLFERARELRPDDPIVMNQVRRITIKSIPPAGG